MNFIVWSSYAVAAATAVIAALALRRDRQAFVNRVFALGMALFAMEATLTGLLFQAASLDSFLFWQRMRFTASSFLPAVWLTFSLSFARANYREQISRWKWVLVLSLIVPVALTLYNYNEAFVSVVLAPRQASAYFIRLGQTGYWWHLAWVVLSVVILMNLERTFRHATGHMRWQTKFLFLGIGGVFGIHVFTDSQALLFKGVDTDMVAVGLGALLVADVLAVRSLLRGQPLSLGIQLSHQFLYNSLTMLIVGIYFIVVGLLAWASLRFEWIENVHVSVFLVFVLIIGLAAVLMSDRLRLRRKRFISRHLKRPQYDYQKIWEDFTGRTAQVTGVRQLCGEIVRMVSETLEILSVSIWLADEKQESLSFGGSTVFTAGQAGKMGLLDQGGAALIRAMEGQEMPVDLEGRGDDWVSDLKQTYGEETKESRIRYCVPLNAAGHLVGVMTLSEKVFYQPLTFEESELVRTIANQAAAALMNLTLAERLRQAKELEAFQTMSAFFMHDLKNLASKLSLVTQNLPEHMDNPEFRADALKTLSQSVTKINGMSSRLSMLSQKLALSFQETDLNELVEDAVADTKGYVKVPVSMQLGVAPALSADRDQLLKVLENLLMNASDAVGNDGRIGVSTGRHDNWAVITVMDTGCGMTREFMEKNLFRPFQTTKKQGMGIGLYHCKTIVEAHGGRIHVESEEGKGTAFKVLLPLERQG
ncbi:MAG: Sensor protein ZraS [Syntrophus sp. PtaB.Bin138]|nr:MAG: Sensor protein ZraS [Syntrophus sp. PtaB.Bin138]